MLGKSTIALIVLLLVFNSCKKETAQKELFPVSVSNDSITFSNFYSDTVSLEFALIRTADVHPLHNGTLNDGFALDTGTLPLSLLPNESVALGKQRFVYKTDTLLNLDVVASIAYNIREFNDSNHIGIVTTYTKNF